MRKFFRTPISIYKYMKDLDKESRLKVFTVIAYLGSKPKSSSIREEQVKEYLKEENFMAINKETKSIRKLRGKVVEDMVYFYTGLK